MELDLNKINADLRDKSPEEVVRWAAGFADGRAIVSTNFRPYEAVILHMVTRVCPDIPVLWADTGYNTPDTYAFAEKTIAQLNLKVHRFIPARTAAHRDALNQGIPSIDDPRHEAFTQEVKIEPFMRGFKELAPRVWFTALRRDQTPFRETLDKVSFHNPEVIKVSPVFYFTDADMEAYLEKHGLPDEKNYYDPTKVLEKRECGLHLDSANRI